jgi:hypothetical protein
MKQLLEVIARTAFMDAMLVDSGATVDNFEDADPQISISFSTPVFQLIDYKG